MAESTPLVEAANGPAAEPPSRDLVGRHLPALRRFARAVLGSQRAGDGWVATALERVIDGSMPLTTASIRIDLFRALVTTPPVPTVVPLRAPTATVADEAILVERLRCLDDLERLLVLLVDLEGLAPADAAAVVGLVPEGAAETLGRGRAALRAQPQRRVLIVEDESIIALDLAETVTALGHVVIGIATTYRQAIAEAARSGPNLVLADIQLADDSSGIDVVNALQAVGPLPVVFITAFPERLLTGARPEPAFLITKPFDRDMLAVAMAQAIATAGQDEPSAADGRG